jgi:hypothetical protein
MFEQLGTVDLPTDYDLTPERFKSKFAQGESMHPWTQFVDYLETEQMLLIRRTAGLFFGIPKNQLDAETLARVQTLLQTVGLKRA